MAQLLAVFTKLESRLIGERTNAALAVKCAQGVLGLAGAGISFSDQVTEQLPEFERKRWMAQKRVDGWSATAPVGCGDPGAKIRPDLVPYSELEKDMQDKDRWVGRDMPGFLARLNFRLEWVPLGESQAIQT